MTLTTAPHSDVDLFTDEALTDPYPLYAELRELGPVVHLDRLGIWALPRYEQTRAVLADWQTFTSEQGVSLNEQMSGMQMGTVQAVDPPLHDTMRTILANRLSPRAIRRFAPDIEAKSRTLVGRLVRQGSFDAVTDLAQVFPMQIVGDMIGFPEEAKQHMLHWADSAFQGVGPLNDRALAGFPVLQEMFTYLMGLGEKDFVDGGLGRAMFDAAREGELAETDVVPMLWNFTGPAMDTTISLIGHAVWRFATTPDQWELVRRDRTLVAQALMEVLRLDAPIQMFTRFVRRDTEIEGVPIAEGSRVVVMYGAANRDARQYPEPDRFDVTRNPVDHLSFGYGLHGCVGQGLARMEAASVVTALVEAVHQVRLTAPPVRHLNNVVRSLERLPVEVDPVAGK